MKHPIVVAQHKHNPLRRRDPWVLTIAQVAGAWGGMSHAAQKVVPQSEQDASLWSASSANRTMPSQPRGFLQ